MTTPRARFAAPRAALLGTLAGGVLLAACSLGVPPAEHLRAERIERAERAAELMAAVERAPAGTIYLLDGVVVTREAARAVAAEAIERAVMKPATALVPASISIVTRVPVAQAGDPARVPAPPGEPAAPLEAVRIRGTSQIGAPTPVLLVDGVRRPYDARTTPFADFPPNEIESVSVIKDPARGVELVGADGANGVIIVRTKDGPDDGLRLPEAGNLVAATSISIAQSEGGMTRAQLDAALAQAHPQTRAWFIDGQQVRKSDALALNPAEVVRIIVTHDASDAMRTGLGADAEHGMVQIETTRGRTPEPAP